MESTNRLFEYHQRTGILHATPARNHSTILYKDKWQLYVCNGTNVFLLDLLKMAVIKIFLDNNSDEIRFFVYSRGYFIIITATKKLQFYYKDQLLEVRDLPEDIKLDMIVQFDVSFGYLILTTTNSLLIYHRNGSEIPSELYTRVDFHQSISSVCFPSTYKNKIFISFSDGRLELWNIKSRALVYSFVTKMRAILMEPTCVLDVVLLADQDGKIMFFNLKKDKSIMELHNNTPITAMAMRNDSENQFLITFDSLGHAYTWDLKTRIVVSTYKKRSTGPMYMTILNKTSLMVLIGNNCIDLIDMNNGGYQLVKELHGLPNNTSVVDFALANLAKSHANIDSDQSNVIVVVNHSGKLGHRPVVNLIKSNKKTIIAIIKLDKLEQLKPHQISRFYRPPFIAISTNLSVPLDCGHSNALLIFDNGFSAILIDLTSNKYKELILTPDNEHEYFTACCVAPDSQFGFLATNSGMVTKVNMQSGLIRAKYETNITELMAMELSVNQLLVAGKRGLVQVWDVDNSLQPKLQLCLKAIISAVHFGANLSVAYSKQNTHVIDMYHIDKLKVTRTFGPHFSPVKQIIVDHANRFMLSLTDDVDNAIRIFDLLSTNLIYVMRFDQPLRQMRLSSDCRTLFTTHMKNEIVVWKNLAFLINFIPRSYVITKLTDLLAIPEVFKNNDDLTTLVHTESKEKATYHENGLITTCLPSHVLMSILHIETIKERNKPIYPVKKTDHTPFLLYSRPSGEVKPQIEMGSKISSMDIKSQFALNLKDVEHRKVFDMMRKLKGSELDYELRLLKAEDYEHFFLMISKFLQYNMPLDFVALIVRLFLKFHFAELEKSNHYLNSLLEIKEAIDLRKGRLEMRLGLLEAVLR